MLFSQSKVKRIFFILFLSLLFFTLGIAVYCAWALQPIALSDQQLSRFVVKKGEGVNSISLRLKENHLTKSDLVFKLYYQLNKDKYQIQAGSFELSPAMNVAEILRILGEGTDDLWITLPEGLRREEIAQSLGKYQLPNYDSEQFLVQTVSLEGKLFPDTYLVPKEINTQDLVTLMNNTFEKRLDSLREEIEQSEYSLNELLTIASLLEREARGLEQMKLISGVLQRRLQLGMPLQVDATLQYANGYNEQVGSWWAVPKSEDKAKDSKFNTYQNPGLPPRPICNPGLDAIQAALTPQPSEYLFYIHDSQGQVHFAKTLEEHNQNINKYLR